MTDTATAADAVDKTPSSDATAAPEVTAPQGTFTDILTADGAPEKQEQSADTTPDATDDKPDADSTAADTPEELVFAGFTESEMRALLTRVAEIDGLKDSLTGHVRKMDSQYGELKSRITQKGQPLTKEQFKKTAELYGEEYAEALAADLADFSVPGIDKDALIAEIEERHKAAQAEREAEIEARVVARLERLDQERVLAKEYGNDWKATAESAEMALWERLQTPEKLAEIETAFKEKPFSEAMGGVLKEFGQWKEQRAKSAARKRELHSSTLPKTGGNQATGTTQMTPAEAASQAFNQARQGA